MVRYGGGPAERSYRISPRVCDNEHNNRAFTCPTSEQHSGQVLRVLRKQIVSCNLSLRRTIGFFVSCLLEIKVIKATASFAVRTRFVTRVSDVEEKCKCEILRSAERSEAMQNLIYFVTHVSQPDVYPRRRQGQTNEIFLGRNLHAT